VLRELVAAARRSGPYADSAEELTPAATTRLRSYRSHWHRRRRWFARRAGRGSAREAWRTTPSPLRDGIRSWLGAPARCVDHRRSPWRDLRARGTNECEVLVARGCGCL
jgi:hypothetical protein